VGRDLEEVRHVGKRILGHGNSFSVKHPTDDTPIGKLEEFGVVDPSPGLPVTQMKRLFKKIKREKSPKPPQQPTLPGKPVDIAAGPPDFRTELDDNFNGGRSPFSQVPEVDSLDTAILPDEGGRIGPRILFQDGLDANQRLPASGDQTSDVVIGGDGCGSLLAGVCFSDSLR
jgi:hypothetical protein